MDVGALLARLDRLEAQDAIRRLKARYMQLCDDKAGRAIAELFWPDGVWEAKGGGAVGAVRGQRAIADMFEASPGRLTFTTHYLTNESIEVTGDAARGCWKLLEPCTFREYLPLWMGGHYRDVFERRGGEWRFRHLLLAVEFRTPYESGWVKERFADLSQTADAAEAMQVRLVDHVAYSVPDLEQAVHFFRDVLGAELLYRRAGGTLGAAEARAYGVREGASFTLAKLRLAGTKLELFAYREAGGDAGMAPNARPGGGHIGLKVADTEAARARLAAEPGVTLLGEISTLPEGHPLAGRRWLYFLTPWGQQLELLGDPA